jgi:hypothetical protein
MYLDRDCRLTRWSVVCFPWALVTGEQDDAIHALAELNCLNFRVRGRDSDLDKSNATCHRDLLTNVRYCAACFGYLLIGK